MMHFWGVTGVYPAAICYHAPSPSETPFEVWIFLTELLLRMFVEGRHFLKDIANWSLGARKLVDEAWKRSHGSAR